MNYAKLEKSDRLKRANQFLSDGRWHSTRDIIMGAEVMAVNSAVSELRRNGIPVEHRQEGRLHFYRIPKGQVELFAEEVV